MLVLNHMVNISKSPVKVRSYAIEFSFSIARCVKSIHPITLYMVCPYAEQFEVSFDVPFNLLHSRISE